MNNNQPNTSSPVPSPVDSLENQFSSINSWVPYNNCNNIPNDSNCSLKPQGNLPMFNWSLKLQEQQKLTKLWNQVLKE
jgi:hypothetical protein